MIDLVNAFLNNEPRPWNQLISTLAQGVGKFVDVTLVDSTETEAAVVARIADRLYESMTDPVFLRDVLIDDGRPDRTWMLKTLEDWVNDEDVNGFYGHSGGVIHLNPSGGREEAFGYQESGALASHRARFDEQVADEYLRIAIESAMKSDGRISNRILILDTLPDASLLLEIEKHPKLLRELNWRKFEELLARILERLGYSVVLTPKSKDGGVDIIAIQSHPEIGDIRLLVEAKAWRNKVDVKPVRQLLSLENQDIDDSRGASKLVLATTSQFTAGAWQLQRRNRWQLELRDYDGVLEWIRRANRA